MHDSIYRKLWGKTDHICRDRKHVRAAQAGGVRATGTSEVTEMFPILVAAVVAWAYMFVKTH